MTAPIRVLFVCMGNICRSPMAKGIFDRDCQAAGVGEHIESDSAGTHEYNVGASPDQRAIEAAANRQADIQSYRGRMVESNDFHTFDYIIAMDTTNLNALKYLCPIELRDRVQLLMDFAGKKKRQREIPDPYRGKEKHFETALDLIEEGSRALLDVIIADHFHTSRSQQ